MSPITAAVEWDRFNSDLALCLGDLGEDEFLIITVKGINYFVQFAGQGKFGMRIEAASNSFIEPPDALLTVEDYARMAALGWFRATNPPPHVPGEPEPIDGSPNFFMDCPSPVPYAELAEVSSRTFREVYQVRHPAALQYLAFDKDGSQIRFPTLRIRRWVRR